MEKIHNPYDNMLKIVKEAVDILGYTDSDIEAIKYLERELKVTIPVRTNDGTIKVFEGYRVQHSTSCGPVRGGVRFHPAVNPGEVRALAAWMVFGCAVVNTPYDGGKGSVVCDPNELSENGIRAITRKYTAAIVSLMRPEQDIPAPNVGTNASVMGWMMDTHSTLEGHCIHGVVTGKPIYLDGTLGRSGTTGRGVMYTTKNTLNKMGTLAEGTTVAIQGAGNVGSIAAKLLHGKGMKVTAASNISGEIYNPDGLNVSVILDYLSLNKKDLSKDYNEGGMSRTADEELPEMDVRVLVPAAPENQIDASSIYEVHAGIVVEAVNDPVAADANGILQDRGITVIPGILVNTSGVVVSYFEWAQGIRSVSWAEEEVNEKLKSIMDPAFKAVWDIAMRQSATLCTGVYLIAMKRVVRIKAARTI